MSGFTLSPQKQATKVATMARLREQAAQLHLAVGQVWRHIGAISLVEPTRRLHTAAGRIRIVQVAGQGRARTTRFVKVDPPRGGNGGFDRQSHPITALELARAWQLVDAGDTTS
jgi:hypothetical protein